MIDEQGPAKPARKSQKSVTSSGAPSKRTASKKAAPVKKAGLAKKAGPVKRAGPVKKTAPAKTAASAVKATAKKAAPTRKTAPTAKSVPSRKAPPSGKAVAGRKAVPARKALPATEAGAATKAAGPVRKRTPRPSKAAPSFGVTAEASAELNQVAVAPDAPPPPPPDLEEAPLDTAEAPPPPPEDDAAPAAPPAPVAPSPEQPTGRPATMALLLAIVALAVSWLSVVSLVLAVVILVAVVAVVVASLARRQHRPRSTAALVIAGLALVVGVVTAGAVAWSERSPGGVKYTELVPGDCLKKPASTLVRADRVDCAKPHDIEVFFTFDELAPRGAPFPGQDALQRDATIGCRPQFESYVGVPFDQSQLDVTFFVPTEENWEDGNRRLLCTVAAKSGQLTGSVRGSQR